MVAVKGKSSALTSQIGKNTKSSKTGSGVRPFKIYPETSNVKFYSGAESSICEAKKYVQLNARSNISTMQDMKTKSGITMNSDKTKVTLNTRRKVLADISNVGGSVASTRLHNSTKPMALSGPDIKILSCPSRKPSMGESRRVQVQAGNSRHSLRKAGDNKDMKAASVDQRIRAQGRVSVTADSRTRGRNPVPPTRNSLPILKSINKVLVSGANKESAESSEEGRAKYAFPVRPRVGRYAVPQATNSRSTLRRDRVSEGFSALASKDQAKVDTGPLSKKPAKPGMRITSSVVKGRRTSRSSVFDKSMPSSNISLEETEKAGLISESKSVATTVSAEEGISSGGNSMLEKTLKNVSRAKSLRRKSFTSLLMEKPKLLKELGEATKKEALPDIYDDQNHLEVTEYVDDIYLYYWVMEAHAQPLKTYMENQTDITLQMRAILINWLIEVHLKFDLMHETLFLTVSLLDQYLSVVSIKKNEMQLVGLTALLLASKYEDYWHPKVMDLISISAESYTRCQILEMERDFLKKLKFRLNMPTPYVFMLRFLKAAQSDKKFEHLAFYLIELCLVQYEAINYKPSLLCASAIYLARNTLQLAPAWTPLLAKHARYEESEIRGCAEMILRVHKAARKSQLKVTYEKYMKHDYSRVAAIKPLDTLPI